MKVRQAARLGLALRFGIRLGHDIEVPAAQLARQADVLPATADRLGKFVFGDRDYPCCGSSSTTIDRTFRG